MPITAALKQATGTIPIVFNAVNDPVGQGRVPTDFGSEAIMLLGLPLAMHLPPLDQKC